MIGFFLLTLVCFPSVSRTYNLNVRKYQPRQRQSFGTEKDSDENTASTSLPLPRREIFSFCSKASLSSLVAFSNSSPIYASCGSSIRLPLTYIPRLEAYVIYYRVGGQKFGAIIDTGSPFLTVPGYCDTTKWGCYRESDSEATDLSTTTERFDNGVGQVEWRKAPLSLISSSEGCTESNVLVQSNVIFGVLSESLMSGPGGVFFGLIKYTDRRIRPSLLSQTNVQSFQIDLASSEPSLILSSESLHSSSDFVPLVRDLQRFGDPTVHYTARAAEVLVNGAPIVTDDNFPIYVIIDTGVSGLVVSEELWRMRYREARTRREKSLWGEVGIQLDTKNGQTPLTLCATKPLTTPLGERPWPKFRKAHLIVAGLAFLRGHVTTIDADNGRLWID